VSYLEKANRRANRDPELCAHGNKICSRCVVVTDAARRASDTINGMVVFHGSWDLRNSWMAFRLADGTSDGNLYDTKADAIRHVSNYKYYFFFCFRNSPGGSNPRDMQLWIDMHRHAYDHGGNLTDPDAKDGGPDMIVDTKFYDSKNNRSRPTLIPGINY
jgi:hypothetical protein